MVDWVSIEDSVPLADKEFVAKNPNSESRKKCRVIRFNEHFTQESIKKILIQDGYIEWSYV